MAQARFLAGVARYAAGLKRCGDRSDAFPGRCRRRRMLLLPLGRWRKQHSDHLRDNLLASGGIGPSTLVRSAGRCSGCRHGRWPATVAVVWNRRRYGAEASDVVAAGASRRVEQVYLAGPERAVAAIPPTNRTAT